MGEVWTGEGAEEGEIFRGERARRGMCRGEKSYHLA